VDWCCMCKRSSEKLDHLLLHCPTTAELWAFVFVMFRIRWVLLNWYKSCFNIEGGNLSLSDIESGM
jgi:hypothetical protein